MKKKVLSLLLVAAMAVSMLVGCGEKEPDLVIWAPENQQELLKEQEKQFKEANPQYADMVFEYGIVGEDNAKTEVLKDVEAAADIYFFANDQLTELVNAGAIAKLGGTTAQMVKDTMVESIVNTVSIDGELYGIPFTHNTFFMYYDKTIFTEEEIKSLDTMLAKETAEGVYNFNFDAAGGWKLGAFFYGAGLTVFGEDGYDKAAGCNWNSADGVAVVNYLIDMLKNPKVGNALASDELAKEHKLGAWFDGAWAYNTNKEALGDDLGIAVLPTYTINGTERQLKAFYGTKAIGVNAKAKNMELAVLFATFLGTEEQQVARYNASAQIPTNTKASQIDAVKNDIIAQVILKEVEMATVNQPTAADFGAVYWNYAGAIPGDIVGDEPKLTKENAQEYLDKIVNAMTGK